MVSKTLETADGPVEADLGYRTVVLRDKDGRTAIIQRERFINSLFCDFDKPCTWCRDGLMRRIVITESEVLLECTLCKNHFRYPRTDQAGRPLKTRVPAPQARAV